MTLGVGFGQSTRAYNCVIPSLCLDVVVDPRQGPAEVKYKILLKDNTESFKFFIHKLLAAVFTFIYLDFE